MATWPKISETAVLTVGGRDYKDWESVQVKHALQQRPPYTCRFTCSEGLPIANNFATMQIKPGMDCSVTLAGHPAFKGTVMTRQVYYDAHRHHIEIQCGTFAELSTSSVITKTGEWKDKTFQQIGQEVLDKFGYKMKFEGGSPPNTKFPRVSVTPGETAQDFLDVLGRSISQQLGGTVKFTADENENFVVVLGPSGGQDSITEGKDIIIGREIIYNMAAAGTAPVISQMTGNNKEWGAKVAHVPFVQETMQTIGQKFIPGVIFSEIPTSSKEVMKGRATTENGWLSDDQITVTATVWGWERPSGGLWKRNQQVSVFSPMLIMHGDVLKAKSVTFSQDNNTGTRTTLELCNELALGASGVAGGIK